MILQQCSSWSLILTLLIHCNTEIVAFHSVPSSISRTSSFELLKKESAFQKHHILRFYSHVADQVEAPSTKAPSTKTPRTLYDILGASPTDTRTELKKRYVALARQTHPDAILSSKPSADGVPEFTEVAEAWRILSDKKQRTRYDRALRAEQFTDSLLHWVDKIVAVIFKEDENCDYVHDDMTDREMDQMEDVISVEHFFMTANDELDKVNQDPTLLDHSSMFQTDEELLDRTILFDDDDEEEDHVDDDNDEEDHPHMFQNDGHELFHHAILLGDDEDHDADDEEDHQDMLRNEEENLPDHYLLLNDDHDDEVADAEDHQSILQKDEHVFPNENMLVDEDDHDEDEVEKEEIVQETPPVPFVAAEGEVEQLNEALQSVQVAEQMAGRAAEVLRLFELSKALENRADREARRAAQIKKNLKALAQNLKTMTSSVSQSSDMDTSGSGHMDILKEFNNTVAALRQTAVDDVSARRREEQKYIAAKKEAATAYRIYQESVQAKLAAKRKLDMAQNAVDEVAARTGFSETDSNAAASLKKAQALVDESNRVLKNAVRKRVEAEVEMKKSKYRLSYRKAALDRLTKEVKNRKMERHFMTMNTLSTGEDETEDSRTETLQDKPTCHRLSNLQCEELLMEETSRRLENMADKLKVRALELRLKAEKSWMDVEGQEPDDHEHEDIFADTMSRLHP